MVIKYTYSGSYENVNRNGIIYLTSGSYTTELEDNVIKYEYNRKTLQYPLREENKTHVEDHLQAVLEEERQKDDMIYYNQWQDDPEAVFEYTLFSSSLEES